MRHANDAREGAVAAEPAAATESRLPFAGGAGQAEGTCAVGLQAHALRAGATVVGMDVQWGGDGCSQEKEVCGALVVATHRGMRGWTVLYKTTRR